MQISGRSFPRGVAAAFLAITACNYAPTEHPVAPEEPGSALYIKIADSVNVAGEPWKQSFYMLIGSSFLSFNNFTAASITVDGAPLSVIAAPYQEIKTSNLPAPRYLVSYRPDVLRSGLTIQTIFLSAGDSTKSLYTYLDEKGRAYQATVTGKSPIALLESGGKCPTIVGFCTPATFAINMSVTLSRMLSYTVLDPADTHRVVIAISSQPGYTF